MYSGGAGRGSSKAQEVRRWMLLPLPLPLPLPLLVVFHHTARAHAG